VLEPADEDGRESMSSSVSVGGELGWCIEAYEEEGLDIAERREKGEQSTFLGCRAS